MRLVIMAALLAAAAASGVWVAVPERWSIAALLLGMVTGFTAEHLHRECDHVVGDPSGCGAEDCAQCTGEGHD